MCVCVHRCLWRCPFIKRSHLFVCVSACVCLSEYVLARLFESERHACVAVHVCAASVGWGCVSVREISLLVSQHVCCACGVCTHWSKWRGMVVRVT